MHTLAAFMAGLFCKLYDDFVDNALLTPYSNPVVMEYLKGMHYILVTVLALQQPMFPIVMYVANVLHYFINPSAYSLPYEKSVLYSGLFFFLILKTFRVEVSKLDCMFLLFFLAGHAADPILLTQDVSLFKMCVRFCWLVCCLFYTLVSSSQLVQICYMYFAGYFGVSVVVQAYSLYTAHFHSFCARYAPQWCAQFDHWVDTFLA